MDKKIAADVLGVSKDAELITIRKAYIHALADNVQQGSDEQQELFTAFCSLTDEPLPEEDIQVTRLNVWKWAYFAVLVAIGALVMVLIVDIKGLA